MRLVQRSVDLPRQAQDRRLDTRTQRHDQVDQESLDIEGADLACHHPQVQDSCNETLHRPIQWFTVLSLSWQTWLAVLSLSWQTQRLRMESVCPAGCFCVRTDLSKDDADTVAIVPNA